MQAKGSYTVNTVSLFKKVKILPYSGLDFSLRLNSKYLCDAKFLLFEPVEHPSVDILSVLTLPGSDLPVTILNHTANTVTLKNGFVLGVVSDVGNTNLATDGMQRPAFEIRTLYADQFHDCFPAVKDLSKLQLTYSQSIYKICFEGLVHTSVYIRQCNWLIYLPNLLWYFLRVIWIWVTLRECIIALWLEIRSRWSNICVGLLFILSRRKQLWKKC